MSDEFEPMIVSFCCNWCSYAGADLAGVSRMQYPPNIRIIRVMCSSMVHPNLVIDALTKGADGVLICGCHPGDCHYVSGNLKARRRMVILKSIMDSLGLDSERVWLKWISASEGRKMANTATEITEEIRKQGPNPINEYWSI